MRRNAIAALLLGTCLTLPALADVPTLSGVPCVSTKEMSLSDRDVFRLESLMTSRSRGLAGALVSESAADRAAVAGIYEAGLSPLASIVEGKYQCRTIKLGGLGALTVYGWFECEIGRDGDRLTIEKLTGSQRFSGTLTPAGEGLAYRGALHYWDEEPRPYEGTSDRDQVGCLLKAFEDGEPFVLELPFPAFESAHDVIELRSRQ